MKQKNNLIVIGNKNPCGHGNGGVIYDARGIAPTVCCGDKSYIYILVRSDEADTDSIQETT